MKTNTLKQRLAVYKAAHELYQEKDSLYVFLCETFNRINSDKNFRELEEVIELTTLKQRISYIMFRENHGYDFDLDWNIRNEFLVKLIKHTEKKIAQGKK